MKKYLLFLSFLAWSFVAVAQETKIPHRLELVTVDLQVGDDDSFLSVEEKMEVFNMPIDGVNHYYLSVGHLGIGGDILQINFDHIFELFLPLGDTVAEAMEYLQRLQELYKGPVGGSIEIEGCYAAAFPNDKLEKVKVTYQKVLITNLLAFSIERGDVIMAAHIPKSQFNSLVRNLKIYRKLHPKER